MFAFLQTLAVTITADRNDCQVGRAGQPLNLRLVRRMGAVLVQGKCTQHASLMGKQRHRPAGTQVIPQRQAAKTLPLGVPGDVFGDHKLAPERCGATGSFLWTNGHSMNRLAVLDRQAGRRAAQQAFALGISEQDRAEGCGGLGVEHLADGAEYFVQMMVGRDHPENVTLRLRECLAVKARTSIHGDS